MKLALGFTIGMFAAGFGASSALAEVTPRAGNLDARVRYAQWVDGQVYRVQTQMGRVTSVEFGPDEQITSVIAGDTVSFNFDAVPGGSAFVMKPAVSGAATNINVIPTSGSIISRFPNPRGRNSPSFGSPIRAARAARPLQIVRSFEGHPIMIMARTSLMPPAQRRCGMTAHSPTSNSAATVKCLPSSRSRPGRKSLSIPRPWRTEPFVSPAPARFGCFAWGRWKRLSA